MMMIMMMMVWMTISLEGFFLHTFLFTGENIIYRFTVVFAPLTIVDLNTFQTPVSGKQSLG